MPKVLLTVTEEMLDHTEQFRIYFNIKTSAQAFRQLILDGFKFNGNPLNENAHMERGVKGHKNNKRLAPKQSDDYDEDD